VVDAVRQLLLRDHPGWAKHDQPIARDVLLSTVMDIICQQNLVVPQMTREALAEAVVREIAGFGPIDLLLAEPDVTDIMINGPALVYVEQAGTVRRSGLRFRNEAHLRDTVGRMLAPLGKRVDALCPFVDARLPDGSRLNVVIPPLATQGWTVTIRRFRQEPLSLPALAATGMMSPEMAEFLTALVKVRANLLVAGAAGSGKTTLLNALCACIAPERERLITIEDSQELRLPEIHCVALEARTANLEGLGEVNIRQLVRNALRMRPDRIVIGEVRDAAAFDFLQAINTGHSGSMCSIHANSALDALYRLENLVLTTGTNLVLGAVREYVVSALDVVIHLSRGADGMRRLAQVGVVAPSLVDNRPCVAELVGVAQPDFQIALGMLQARTHNRAGDVKAAELVRLARRTERWI
jgi:pilus assembly protein CpaF